MLLAELEVAFHMIQPARRISGNTHACVMSRVLSSHRQNKIAPAATVIPPRTLKPPGMPCFLRS